jgi:hypothetical protein
MSSALTINQTNTHFTYGTTNEPGIIEDYRYKEIKIIQKFIKKCLCIYNKLNPIYYNKTDINYKDIFTFNICIKSKNDSNNKKRENIIGAIINNKIPSNYYKYSIRWIKLRKEINNYIEKLCELENIKNNNQKCIHKAGRSYHYDFKIIINCIIEFDVEFKFNSTCVENTPQFVSPMNPSQYLENSYEEFYYTNYLPIIVEEFGFNFPEKEQYMKQIHSTNPECVYKLQQKYKNGYKTDNADDIKFYKRCKEISKQSIKNFISNTGLKIEELTNYLLKTQQNKYYMLYKNYNIYLQIINTDNYVIISYKKEPELQRYIAKTKTGNTIKILLRWKNGNGIAYPAFQIS